MSVEPRTVPNSSRSYRQTARARNAAATRARVLSAAEELLIEGVATSLEAVAQRAGTTVPTVLRHFGTRDALVAAATGAAVARVLTARPRVTPGDAVGAARVLAAEYEAHATLLRAADALPSARAVRPATAQRPADAPLPAGGTALPTAARALEAAQRLHRDWLARTFASSLSPLPPVVHRRRLAQLVAVTGPAPWRALRETEHLGAAQATAALAELLRALTR